MRELSQESVQTFDSVHDKNLEDEYITNSYYMQFLSFQGGIYMLGNKYETSTGFQHHCHQECQKNL